MIRGAPALTLAVFLVPIAAGLLGAVLPSFGYFPALGGDGVTVQPWQDLIEYPGMLSATWRSLYIGLSATIISVAIVYGFAVFWRGTRLFSLLMRLVSPLLSVPHVAVAIGLLFLLSPSGWILRALSPRMTGLTRPPDLATAPDPYGVVLILGLVIKEVPFLLLLLLSALNQVRERDGVATALSLGYARDTAWLKAVLPQIHVQMRLPIFAVLAYSVSVVEMPLILLPATQPTLSVLVLRLINDPDLALQFVAAAGATLQFAIVVLSLLAWWGGSLLIARVCRPWISSGTRRVPGGAVLSKFVLGGMVSCALLGGLALLGMGLWSLARRWRFPDALPSQWSLALWTDRWDMLFDPLIVTLATGLMAGAIALILVVANLENEVRSGRQPGRWAMWMLYLPLLIPQVSFLFGTQVLMILFGIDGNWGALVWAHLLFVLPYMFLSLSEPYRKLDRRYRQTARVLGKRPHDVLRRVILPLLFKPILISCAVGFAVSVSQYLPTLFAGGGRFATLTTEAVALSSGGDRRLIGLYVAMQSLLPLLAFFLAMALPAFLYRHRRGMRGLNG